jgi:hypothetical protein
MQILAGIVALFAILSLALAIREAIAIVRLSPANTGLRHDFLLSWWKFGELEARIGPDARPHLAIYKRSAIAFVVFVVVGLVLGGISSNMASRAATMAERDAPINGPSVIPAQFAFQIPLPVPHAAAMPMTVRQES